MLQSLAHVLQRLCEDELERSGGVWQNDNAHAGVALDTARAALASSAERRIIEGAIHSLRYILALSNNMMSLSFDICSDCATMLGVHDQFVMLLQHESCRLLARVEAEPLDASDFDDMHLERILDDIETRDLKSTPVQDEGLVLAARSRLRRLELVRLDRQRQPDPKREHDRSSAPYS